MSQDVLKSIYFQRNLQSVLFGILILVWGRSNLNQLNDVHIQSEISKYRLFFKMAFSFDLNKIFQFCFDILQDKLRDLAHKCFYVDLENLTKNGKIFRG